MQACLVCGFVPEPSDPRPDPKSDPEPYAATRFYTKGHYGSTLIDWSDEYLRITVCDSCLRERCDRVLQFEQKTTSTVTERKW